MIKSILVLLCGIGLTLLLAHAGEWINQNTTIEGRIERENKNATWQEWERIRLDAAYTTRRYGISQPEAFWRRIWQDKLLINPLIILVDGLLVGLFLRKWAWLLATISLIPFLLYSLGRPNPYLFYFSLLCCAGYMLLGATTAFIVSRLAQRSQKL
jgi:hypothetical protein